ncbi:MAG: SRPBCC family protein [Rhodothalassiaceae bacterium]
MKKDRISRQIQIDADPHRVWEALSDPASFGQWFCVTLDGPFIVGQTTTGTMTYPGCEGLRWTSVTEVMEPPARLVLRWPDLAPGEDVGSETVWLAVEFSLRPRDGGTLVTVTETGFAALPEDRHASMLRDNAAGWDIQTVNLKTYVEG